jgi:HK97 gp10 family phage protein
MEIKGLNSVLSDIKKYGAEAVQDIEAVTEQVARNIEKYAKSSAPADLGKLGQSIQAVRIDRDNWKVEAGGVLSPYAPFVEFGTGGLVEVPEELKDQAIKFKGKGIRKVNLRARPFLYPSLVRGRIEYIEKLKKVLEKYGKSKQIR